MNENKTSAFSNGLLWFGAGVSIAEILTGMLLAPLGFVKGFAAILIGHLIGGTIMYFAGLIGGRTGYSAMETVRISFGRQGAQLFAGLNVIQLIGWTAVMIASAAAAANTIAGLGSSLWSGIIGIFIAFWIVLGLKQLGKINIVVMAALFVLTIVLSAIVFQGDTPQVQGEITFGAAVELAVAMPLSWLPIISDYTRTAAKPALATAVSCSTYFIASSWMFIIGMGAALLTGQDDIAAIMVQAGMGITGILVVLLSTVTTTFLDAFSAGVSGKSMFPRLSEKILALIVTAIGVLLAVFTEADRFQDFLYLIGSVFAPMTAILLSDYFILRKDHSQQRCNWLNIALWGAGFILYRILLAVETPLGITFPVIVIIMICSTVIHRLVENKS
ncbi:hydrogenase expression protein [Megasphaera cerevisiae DSM 20462]|jgi:putative hydroxymethylpyrimidine transporter CytX|uniref:Hydrogenase expression protein n=1 Tax=Megasphaera cerevisiae DSM 20462 TaxID=1122219 RepID=A0A0J6WSI1_9FIRM|nr:putative hydroxymethylpyrimidine transporter CytX [Megasphaera cerevisiae]KMO86470.1 hydrogenase expression protein [Megasphaera cerevisiae DSM 20462]OKY53377.1 cytosine permease [Megasphaera cerevisiae]SJZ94612.1 putative hydroxymethylpyrimidine transporter CytX [Megasphaera cerevisiae DSM 20462]